MCFTDTQGPSCVLQVLGERGVKEGELEAALQAQLAEVAALRTADEGVNMVLLASAQFEMEALRARAAEQAARAADLESRSVACAPACLEALSRF